MVKLQLPPVNPDALLNKCLEGEGDYLLTGIFTSISNTISSANEEYIEKALIGELSTISREEIFQGYHLKNDFIRLYEEHMSKSKGYAKALYNTIIENANVCGMCFHQIPYNLDHYLPKSKYPVFSVYPYNLIPSCRDCNTHKGTYTATEPDEELLHPYFDDNIFFNEPWLEAVILETTPATAVFKASTPNEWGENKQKRLEKHLTKYKLGRLYSAQAINEISAQIHLFKGYYEREGAEGLKLYLERNAESRNMQFPNSWQASLYRGLSKSEWFYSEYCAN